VVAGAPQPAGHDPERVVARQEAGDQQDRLPVRVRKTLTPVDRVSKQGGGLKTDPALAPDRREREK
jgi:hypothetical protein